MPPDNWSPSASNDNLKMRAGLLKRIRQYFDGHNIMEVETPMMSACATVDLHIESFSTHFFPIGGEKQACYFHTSPEFSMKRLLSAGSGDIYFLGKVFRNGEAEGRHNPEFTMLEYYRLGMNQQQLMSDVSQLLDSATQFVEEQRISYGDVFEKHLNINPHQASDEQLNTLVKRYVDAHLEGLERNDCLDLLFSIVIEPTLGKIENKTLYGVYVYDYPASMSALARLHVNNQGETVAARFELFIKGVELANGYHELKDSEEQKRRFVNEQNKRKESKRTVYPYDYRLVSALEHGFPDCAGVAIGVDRLMMLIADTKSISDVIAFDFSRA